MASAACPWVVQVHLYTCAQKCEEPRKKVWTVFDWVFHLYYYTSLQRSVGTLKKSVDSLYLLGDRAQKCADRITARARYTDTPAFQGQDGRRVHSVEKYGALRRGRGKNKGYLC